MMLMLLIVLDAVRLSSDIVHVLNDAAAVVVAAKMKLNFKRHVMTRIARKGKEIHEHIHE